MKVLDLYITKVCNLNCEYCYVDLEDNEQSFDVWKFWERIHLLNYDHIKFFGWEPLLKWNDIKNIVESIKKQKNNMSFTIVTNGILLDKEKLLFCLENNVEVIISMHYKWLKQILSKLQWFTFAKSLLWFSFIFETEKLSFPYKIINLLQWIGFVNFVLTPEIYSDWNTKNLLLLEEELWKLEKLFIENKNINFKWIDWDSLKLIVKWCEKTIVSKEWDIFSCNRFKDIKKLKIYNYKYIYNKFDEIIDADNDKYKWFYICTIWWFLDSLNINANLNDRIIQFKNLNVVFVKFYKKLNSISWKLTFLSDDVNEIRFNLTSQCNIRCDYCYVDFKNDLLNEKIAKNIIDFILSQDGESKTISFFWWEPLLEFQLLKDLVIYANKLAKEKNKKLYFNIATNFLLIDDDKSNFLKSNNFSIHISFNWRKEINDNMRYNSTDLLLSNLGKYSNIIWKENIVILLAFSNLEVNNLFNNVDYIYNLWYKNISLELVFWDKYLWDKTNLIILKKELLKIKESHFNKSLNLINLKDKNKFLDISVDWKVWENSFGFNEYKVNLQIKAIVDKLISNIF